MPEHQHNQPSIHAQTDLWGDTASTSPAKSRRKKKGPPMIEGQTLHQSPLFSDPSVTRPVFPATPMKTDTGLPALSDEGTLFSPATTASELETQPELFSASAPTPPSVTGHVDAPRPALPRDPEVEIPEDLRPFVTHIPRYLQDKAHQKQSVMDFIQTRFFIVSYDQGQ